MNAMKVVHTVMRLAAEHRSAVTGLEPMLRLVSRAEVEGVPSETVAAAMRQELVILGQHHARLAHWMTVLREALPQEMQPDEP